MNTIVVIYHKADFDGIFCREITKKFLPNAHFIGWDYGDLPPKIDPDSDLYMLDISVDALMDHPRLIWIDHHKSAIEKFNPDIKGYRIDGVAACRLAWQWFVTWKANGRGDRGGFQAALPPKESYVDRSVIEPIAVRLAGEYDVWDKRDPQAELFQHGLKSQKLDPNIWRLMLGVDCYELMVTTVGSLLERGEAVQYAKEQENEGIIKDYGFTVQFEGLTFLACNHARLNSHLFTAGIEPEHDALLGFNFDGQKGHWRVSLYHVPGKEQHDLSRIAVKYGGGGHRGACGFRLDRIPFLQDKTGK